MAKKKTTKKTSTTTTAKTTAPESSSKTDSCCSSGSPCKCRGILSSLFAIGAIVGAVYTTGLWRIVLIIAASLFALCAITGFLGKYCGPCCCNGGACEIKAAKAAPKKASKKKKQ